jgi:hypothetical protein
MSFNFFVILFILLGSYWYIIRFDKSTIRITLDELKVYKKLTIAATAAFIVGIVLSFIISQDIVEIFYFVSLLVIIYAEYYVFKRFNKVERA